MEPFWSLLSSLYMGGLDQYLISLGINRLLMVPQDSWVTAKRIPQPRAWAAALLPPSPHTPPAAALGPCLGHEARAMNH